MNNKTIALLVLAFGAVGISAAGIAVAAVLLTQHYVHPKDHPPEVAASVALPDQTIPDRNARLNRQTARANVRLDRGNFQGRDGGGNFQGRGGGGMMMLNEDQRQVLQDAQQEANEKLRELEEKLRTAQRETLEAALTSAPDEKAIRNKAEAMAAVQIEMTLVRAKALSALAPNLEPEQRQQMAESPMGVMLLNGGRMGFAGGPGGEGPGGGRRPGGGGPDNPGRLPDR